MPNGTVKWYNEGKGCGIIVSDDGRMELAVSFSAISDNGFAILYDGQHVSFDVVSTSKGQSACNVVPL